MLELISILAILASATQASWLPMNSRPIDLRNENTNVNVNGEVSLPTGGIFGGMKRPGIPGVSGPMFDSGFGGQMFPPQGGMGGAGYPGMGDPDMLPWVTKARTMNSNQNTNINTNDRPDYRQVIASYPYPPVLPNFPNFPSYPTPYPGSDLGFPCVR